MLDQKPWTRSAEIQKTESIKYHTRINELSEEDLQTFIDDEIDSHTGTVDALVEKIESFMNCLLPYDKEKLESCIQELDDYDVYIHQAMCCLGSVAGKTNDGVKLGEDCSYFGRFHGRLEEYFLTCMIHII
jgi:hypothetical protein